MSIGYIKFKKQTKAKVMLDDKASAGMSFKKHFIYWILPSSFTLACTLIYFYNLFGLEDFIAPKINREFGLIENVQLLLLILIFLRAIKGIRTREAKIEKYGFLLVAIVTAFMILEEIDYGLHYYDYLTGKPQITQVVIFDKKVRNIHNNGPMQNLFKLTAYGIIIIFFVIFPLMPLRFKEKHAVLNFLSPSRFIISTAVCLLILNQIALYLYHKYNSPTRSLTANVSEFEEIMIYYIVLLYISEMVKKPQGMLSAKAHAKKT
jgi:asparagine N-glycosylation enzyme membrane subunit Stt3